jgi:hypothetical protein
MKDKSLCHVPKINQSIPIALRSIPWRIHSTVLFGDDLSKQTADCETSKVCSESYGIRIQKRKYDVNRPPTAEQALTILDDEMPVRQ